MSCYNRCVLVTASVFWPAVTRATEGLTLYKEMLKTVFNFTVIQTGRSFRRETGCSLYERNVSSTWWYECFPSWVFKHMRIAWSSECVLWNAASCLNFLPFSAWSGDLTSASAKDSHMLPCLLAFLLLTVHVFCT